MLSLGDRPQTPPVPESLRCHAERLRGAVQRGELVPPTLSAQHRACAPSAPGASSPGSSSTSSAGDFCDLACPALEEGFSKKKARGRASRKSAVARKSASAKRSPGRARRTDEAAAGGGKCEKEGGDEDDGNEDVCAAEAPALQKVQGTPHSKQRIKQPARPRGGSTGAAGGAKKGRDREGERAGSSGGRRAADDISASKAEKRQGERAERRARGKAKGAKNTLGARAAPSVREYAGWLAKVLVAGEGDAMTAEEARACAASLAGKWIGVNSSFKGKAPVQGDWALAEEGTDEGGGSEGGEGGGGGRGGRGGEGVEPLLQLSRCESDEQLFERLGLAPKKGHWAFVLARACACARGMMRREGKLSTRGGEDDDAGRLDAPRGVVSMSTRCAGAKKNSRRRKAARKKLEAMRRERGLGSDDDDEELLKEEPDLKEVIEAAKVGRKRKRNVQEVSDGDRVFLSSPGKAEEHLRVFVGKPAPSVFTLPRFRDAVNKGFPLAFMGALHSSAVSERPRE